jgi:hypothetical protein
LLRSALSAQASHFETHHLYFKVFLSGDLSLQTLERGTVELLDLSAMKARQMQMVFLRFDFVIVLFPVEVHEIQLIDQAQPLQQLQGPVDGRAIDVRVALARAQQQGGGVKMGIRLLDGFDQRAPLRRQTNALCLYLIQQIAALQHLFQLRLIRTKYNIRQNRSDYNC